MSVNNKYYIRLDIIRIVSCILVLLYHLNVIKGGFLAVCTFFTLSGYLTCVSALKYKEFSIKKYYINRIKRVYIPLLIVVSITVFLARQIINVNWLNLKQETISSIFGFNNIWQLKVNSNYFTKNIHSPFIHLWYISILMQFDLIFPFLFVLIKKIDQRRNNFSTNAIFVLAIISTFVFYSMSKTRDIMTVYYNTFLRSFSILWGVFFAIIHHKFIFKLQKIQKKYNKLIYIIYLVLLVFICMIVSDKSSNYSIWMILMTIITIRLIKFSIIYEIEKTNRIINFFTKISYEIYLVHLPIIYFMQNIDINELIKVPIIIIISVLIAYLIHLLINIKFSNKIYRHIKIAVISILILIGGFTVLFEKDNTSEMNELKNKLDKNSKIAEQKNKEFLNRDIKVDDRWKIILENGNLDNSKKTEENKKDNGIDEIKEKNELDIKNAVTNKIKNMPIVGIGDSVFLDAVDLLYKKFPNGYFDGKISRSLIGGREVILNLNKKGKLSNIVVLALSTNGDYSEKRNKEIMQILGKREVFWINAVGADDPKFNERFKKFAINYPNLHIIDWEKAAKNHPEYFYPDGIHAKNNGIKVYVNTIYETIYNYYYERYKANKK